MLHLKSQKIWLVANWESLPQLEKDSATPKLRTNDHIVKKVINLVHNN